MDVKLEIPLNGLTCNQTCFCWQVGKEFFESFGNSEIFDSELEVVAIAGRQGRNVLVSGKASGSVTVECDRCLEDLQLAVSTGFELEVRFGDGEDQQQEDGREILYVPETDTEMDLGQIVYDYVCLSLPLQRVHPEGGCNQDALRFLGLETEDDSSEAQPGENNPFAALKGLFGEKQDINN